MFKVTMNKIYLTRGDTARFSIGLINIPGVQQDYELSDTDKIYFIVTEIPEIVDINDLDLDDSKYIFYKEGIDIVLDPSDTMDLEKDTYYYQVRVILGSIYGDIETIIEPTEFFITPIKKVF